MTSRLIGSVRKCFPRKQLDGDSVEGCRCCVSVLADLTSALCQRHSGDNLIDGVLVVQSLDAVVYVIVCVINLPLHRLRHGRNLGDVLGSTLAGGHDVRDGLPTVDQLVAANLLTQPDILGLVREVTQIRIDVTCV